MIKKIVKSKVFTCIMTGIVLPISASLIYDLIKEKTLFTTLVSIFKWIFSFLMKILTLKISLWIILVIIAVSFLIILIFTIIKSKSVNEPDFLKYTMDTINGHKWIWSWEKDVNGKWRIANLRVKCPKCGSSMIKYIDFDEYIFECPLCKFNTKNIKFDKTHEIESIIIDRVKDETYKI